jgi:hypothetical protein
MADRKVSSLRVENQRQVRWQMMKPKSRKPKRRTALSNPPPLANINSLWQSTRPLFTKLQGPKKVEATQQEGIICVGGFSNPLF